MADKYHESLKYSVTLKYEFMLKKMSAKEVSHLQQSRMF